MMMMTFSWAWESVMLWLFSTLIDLDLLCAPDLWGRLSCKAVVHRR